MRHFIYFSSTARTSGNFDTSQLMQAGRMDIAIHTIIAAFFLSHDVREDVKVHLIFYGMPDPPKHIEIQASKELDLSKKDMTKQISEEEPEPKIPKNIDSTDTMDLVSRIVKKSRALLL